MFIVMTPGTQHSYYLTQKKRVIDLTWPPPPRKTRPDLKGGLLRLLHGSPSPHSPQHNVDPAAFDEAVKVLDKQDIELAIEAFTGLGYEVTVRTLR
ncbi:hypothetical protein Achl_4098 (plasmid) [Pseudarthrobacter chlorophenolicus A6]|uniref:Uncharacterized protein n=1 Tax=Pseudarthrobacter chlorophenolicus (strain ATCC 700700 / DSM 12829 / CIP 107037 / JCM 12360 / KCTC 9906 / NCIMB 13794 / A6) TaxID=452863 RepID=B8HI02_PSECP|nr:hypothetical protein [Pseudarthrobacter chlorophenolicus]ACL42049.1 hypothetical protein Achl_4098 [Pseudarthrobacter chlorophenolicus A6]SDQ20841.1 hypothetical protein SAMN04489738_0748 [Pseudarthrobacter chlorophenolicus]